MIEDRDPNNPHESALKLRQQAQEALGEAQVRALDYVDAQKGELSQQLQDMAAAARGAVDALDGRQNSLGAGLARDAASGFERAADTLAESSPQDLAGAVSRFARARPETFVLGAVLAGALIGRFARASTDRPLPAPDAEDTADLPAPLKRTSPSSSHDGAATPPPAADDRPKGSDHDR